MPKYVGGGGLVFGGTITPTSNDGAALGTASLSWSDLFLASGGVINFANGNVTATHSSGALTLAGHFLFTDNTYDIGASGATRPRTVYVGTSVVHPAGTGSGTYIPLGVLSVNTTVVGNVDAGEDDLMSYSLPANSLSANGKAVRVTAWGTTANNANAKTLTVYFGATAVGTVSLSAGQANFWRYSMLVIRTGAATQVAYADMVGGTDGSSYNMSDGTTASPTETLSGAVTIKLTGEGVATNDIVQRGMMVEFLN